MSEVAESVTTEPMIPVGIARAKKVSKGFFATSFAIFFRSKLNIFALVLFSIIALLSYGAGWISENILHEDRDQLDFDLVSKGIQLPAPPGTFNHLLGTDELGRDILTRLLYGGQVSLTIGFLVAAISIFIGTLLGLLAGYYGGWVDDVVNMLVQVILNIPALFLLIMLSIYVSPSIVSLSLLIGLLSWPLLTRQVRGAVLSLRTRDYIAAAEVMGASSFRILLVHILPNVVSLMIVVAGFTVAAAILIESALSYLNFGISVPVPSWGSMLSDSTNSLYQCALDGLYPGPGNFPDGIMCLFNRRWSARCLRPTLEVG